MALRRLAFAGQTPQSSRQDDEEEPEAYEEGAGEPEEEGPAAPKEPLTDGPPAVGTPAA